MKRIPIVFILDNFYRGGGTENQLAALIENIDRSIFDLSVLNLREKRTDRTIEIDCEIEYLDLEKPFSLKGYKTVKRVAEYLKKKRTRIFQVYFYDSRIIGTLAGKMAGVEKIVFCRRDFGWWHSTKKLLIVRRLASMSDYCIVNAEAIKKMVIDNERFDENKIEVIYNGIDFGPKPGASELSKSELGVPEDAPLVGMIANYRPVKRPDRFIEIASKVKNKKAHFVLVGEGERDELQKLADRLGIGERVHFYHTVNGVYFLLKLLDIGLLTSESEGLSNVLIEYALGGLPSMAYDTGGNKEIVLDGRTGFILPNGDTDQFAQKLDILLENDSMRQEFGSRGRDIALGKFDLKAMVKKTEDFYLRILNENRV